MWQAAVGELGVPYVYGGGLNRPKYGPSLAGGQIISAVGAQNGLDCSGLTRFAYWKGTGGAVLLPRTAAEQWSHLLARHRVVPQGEVKPGDLLFFDGAAPGHVAIAGPNGDQVQEP